MDLWWAASPGPSSYPRKKPPTSPRFAGSSACGWMNRTVSGWMPVAMPRANISGMRYEGQTIANLPRGDRYLSAAAYTSAIVQATSWRGGSFPRAPGLRPPPPPHAFPQNIVPASKEKENDPRSGAQIEGRPAAVRCGEIGEEDGIDGKSIPFFGLVDPEVGDRAPPIPAANHLPARRRSKAP